MADKKATTFKKVIYSILSALALTTSSVTYLVMSQGGEKLGLPANSWVMQDSTKAGLDTLGFVVDYIPKQEA